MPVLERLSAVFFAAVAGVIAACVVLTLTGSGILAAAAGGGVFGASHEEITQAYARRRLERAKQA